MTFVVRNKDPEFTINSVASTSLAFDLGPLFADDFFWKVMH